MIVIGAGRVGTALARRSEEAGEECILVTRDAHRDALAGPPGDPILVATRNDDLEQVVAGVPEHRYDDLVFVQNGMIRPWLRAHTLGSCTRGLLYFAVPSRGAPVEPGGTSPFCGPHALAMVRWFVTLGLQARQVDWARFSAFELEKIIWNSAFGLLCEVHDEDVGTLCETRRDELTALAAELARVGRVSMGVDFPVDHLVERLCAYSGTIPRYKGAVKEWRWRNGWFVGVARERGIETPTHDRLLEAAGRPTA